MAATTGAFAAVPALLSTGTAHAAEPAPSIDWAPIISCESGGNVHAQNSESTASGLFQFVDGSWRAYGGTKFARRAKDATAEQQTVVANTAFARSGLTPWAASRHCWHGKVSHAGSSTHAVSTRTTHTRTTHTRTTHTPTTHTPTTHTAAGGRHRAPAAVTPGGTYTVAAGDTLTGIASRHGITWQSVWAANKSSVARPNLLHPGEQLKLPTKADLRT
ncbi:MAG TPA: transglycosylase family protein [Pseudonocardia sp.]|jgi:LysM repeat protein